MSDTSLTMMQIKRGTTVQQRERVQPLINSFFASKNVINNYVEKEIEKKVKPKQCTCTQTPTHKHTHTQTHTHKHTQTHTNTHTNTHKHAQVSMRTKPYSVCIHQHPVGGIGHAWIKNGSFNRTAILTVIPIMSQRPTLLNPDSLISGVGTSLSSLASVEDITPTQSLTRWVSVWWDEISWWVMSLCVLDESIVTQVRSFTIIKLVKIK